MSNGDGNQTFARYQPCAFLVAERCSVYQVRPAACAGFAVASPAENCRGPEVRPIAQFNTQNLSGAIAITPNRAFCDTLGLPATHLYLTSLPRGVALILEAWDRRDFRSFLGDQAWLTPADIDAAAAANEAWVAEAGQMPRPAVVPLGRRSI